MFYTYKVGPTFITTTDTVEVYDARWPITDEQKDQIAAGAELYVEAGELVIVPRIIQAEEVTE
jgi:hypothetical protein